MERTYKEISELFFKITEMLPNVYDVDDEYKANHFVTDPDGGLILNTSESKIETLADLFDQLNEDGHGMATTGYYDPEEDERNNEVDIFTGLHYLIV